MRRACRLQLPFLGPAALARIDGLVSFCPKERDRLIARSEGDEIVGFVDRREHEIAYLFVDPSYQGCGVGRQLVDTMQREVQRDIELLCFDSNAAARAFYAAIGFRTLGQRVGRFFGSVQANQLLGRSWAEAQPSFPWSEAK